MSNYVQSTNFATKDALPSGDALKIVRGTEINTEYNNIATAVATKADLNSPTLSTPILVAPALGTPVSGNLANCTFPTLNQSTSGNAATATALQTARTIGGVSFNGTANINLPGVNTFGNQGTSGNAATATNATNATNASTVTTITTNQVLNATAGASVGAVGTYAFLQPVPDATFNAGDTTAGSNLRLSGIFTDNSGNSGYATGAAPTGTWRAMGQTSGGFGRTITVWLRIS